MKLASFLTLASICCCCTFAQPSLAQGPPPCVVNDAGYVGDKLGFQCGSASEPCPPDDCNPALNQTMCRQYALQNQYSVSGYKIKQIDITCVPPPDSNYTVCYAYKYVQSTGQTYNWNSSHSIGSCGDGMHGNFSITFTPSSSSDDIEPGNWFKCQLCHACTKCTWTVTFDNGFGGTSTCTFMPENVKGTNGVFMNCCQ
jgi:hypothetical protein